METNETREEIFASVHRFFSGWLDAKILHSPRIKKVIQFLRQYIAYYGLPKKIRTDQRHYS